MAYHHQPCGAYGAAEEDLYRGCPDCPAAIQRDAEHTPEQCAAERALWAKRQEDDDRDMPRGWPQ